MLKAALFQKEDCVISCLIDSATDRTVEIHADSAGKAGTCIGDIVTGRIEKIVPGIDAAFLILPGEERGYLPASRLEEAFFTKRCSDRKFCQGDELLVQISREPIGGKPASVSTQLSITDSLAVVGIGKVTRGVVDSGKSPAPADPVPLSIRVSKKLDSAAREQLKTFVQTAPGPDGIRPLPETLFGSLPEGWILLRTAAARALSEGRGEEIISQIASAGQKLADIISRAPFLTGKTVHYQTPPPYLSRLKSLPADSIEKVITDNAEIYGQLREEISAVVKTEFYDDPLVSLYSLYRMNYRIGEAVGKVVHLRSGGNLIIEPTQALTVIDVNTGKSSAAGKDPKEEKILRTNLEAAAEAARQIRLRNLSGIILIDFINMRERSHDEKLMEALRGLLAADPVETKAVDMTKLGLVEITRKKTEKPLHEALRTGPAVLN